MSFDSVGNALFRKASRFLFRFVCPFPLYEFGDLYRLRMFLNQFNYRLPDRDRFTDRLPDRFADRLGERPFGRTDRFTDPDRFAAR
jgi:hypothetical protein